MYTTETNFFLVMDAYCRTWEINFSGDDISMLQLMWRETDQWYTKRQKKKMDEQKKKSSGKPANRVGKPSRGRR